MESRVTARGWEGGSWRGGGDYEWYTVSFWFQLHNESNGLSCVLTANVHGVFLMF